MFKAKSKAIVKMTMERKGHAGSRQGSRTEDNMSRLSDPQTLQETGVDGKPEKSIERFKRIAQTTKISAVKKFIKAQEISGEKRATTPEQQRGRYWDDTFANLELSQKRSSEMCREIGIKHVRIVTPTPEVRDVFVARKHKKKPNIMNVGVLRSLRSNLSVKPLNTVKEHRGPQCTEKGEIIPHSLLGDVKSFLSEAEKRGEYKGMVEKQMSESSVMPVRHPGRLQWDPLLNKANALKHWDREMLERHYEQQRLASLLDRPKEELLMCKTDMLGVQNSLHNNQQQYHPDSSFWKLGDRVAGGQIQITLNKTERGHPATPVISGDADSILKMKGIVGKKMPHSLLESEDLQSKDKGQGGMIHVMNQVLFDKLEITGEAVYPPEQPNSYTSLTSANKGDNSSGIPSGATTQLGNICQEFGPIPNAKGDHSDNLLSGEIIQTDKTSLDSNPDPRSDTFKGPALCIDGKVLLWQRTTESSSEKKNHVAKETFILIEGTVGEVARGHVEICNCGTTVIHYNWMKLSTLRPLPVIRQDRRPFYFLADEGTILPHQTIHVPVLFRSKIPGYFSQSWILTTVPLLQGGATIKFTFKGAARETDEYSEKCREIENYLLKNQGRSICFHEAWRIIELSILKASLNSSRLNEEPLFFDLPELFEQENPGLYYHANVLHTLEKMYEAVAVEIGFDRKDKMKNIYSNDHILMVAKLRQVILDIECKEEDYICSQFALKETMLIQLNQEVKTLSFPPLFPLCDQTHQRYIVTYDLLVFGVDSAVGHAEYLAKKLGLTIKDDEDEDSHDYRDIKSGRKRKNAVKTKGKVSSKLKPTKPVSPTESSTTVQQHSGSPEPTVFSNVYKYRSANAGRTKKALLQYDEKVYLKIYSMLNTTLETVCELFDRRDSSLFQHCIY